MVRNIGLNWRLLRAAPVCTAMRHKAFIIMTYGTVSLWPLIVPNLEDLCTFSRIIDGEGEVFVNFDAIVIGGGLAGSATAYHLVREGARALLVDRGDQGQSTFAGAGILSPETTGAFDTEMLPFAFKSATHYTSLVESLHGDGIVETGYTRSSLLLTASEADMPLFQE